MPSETQKKLLKNTLRIVLSPVALLGIAGLCYVYGRVIEVDWIRIKHINIPIENLPPGFNGFKIVHLSDLHIDETGKREMKLPGMVNSVGADAIFITGDFTNGGDGLPVAASVIRQFRSKHGMWGVLGNWDSRRTVTACEDAGVNVLETETDAIRIGNARLGIIGLRFDDALPPLKTERQREMISRLLPEIEGAYPVVLLEHAPRIIHAAQHEDIDLVLSGHTHGGQVRIPFGPAIETPSDMGIWYSKGLHTFEDTYLYMNPGIGLEPGPDFIKVRFWCRPEITVLTLRREE